MSSVNAVFGLSGCALFSLALIATVLRLQRLPVRVRHAVMLAAALALLVPLGDLSITAYVRGAIGDLSIPTLVLAGGACVRQLIGRTVIGQADRRALCWILAVAAAFLYPFALGLTPFDPYALGYGSIGFVTALLFVTLAAWQRRRYLVVLVVLSATLAYLAGAYESRNLWDYLIDPLAALYALAWLFGRALGRRSVEVADTKTQLV
ncbi:MAG TPA: hypothetical protein VK572_12100 [Burkholderiales bacterium]|nr:hypothetical protein [Burkholderiales bacterium]